MSFEADARIVVERLDRFFRDSAGKAKPVLRQPPLADLVRDLGLERHARDGGLTGEALGTFLDAYLAATTRLHHPGYLAHQVAAPHYAGGLAALVDGFTNNAMAIYEMGPAAAAVEFFVVNLLLSKAGYEPAPLPGAADETIPEKRIGGGVLTHGGSLANLTALAAARNRLAPDAFEKGNPGGLALLAPETCHYSITRAAGILGIGRKNVFTLETDPRGVVLPDRLPAALRKVREEGLRPAALVANACSTALGLYDPLSEIGGFCESEKLWFHVDGAHGASALFSEKHRGLLRGIEKADSLVWDAHKLLRTPTLCAAVLVKDSRDLDAAFREEASYLFHEKAQPGFDFIHRTVECTKAGLGLRFFAVLAALGEKGLGAYVDGRYELAVRSWEYLSALPGFECAARPESNILCFRLEGSDELQLAVRERLLAEGNFYVSSAFALGKRWLRLAVMNPDTDLEVVKDLATALQRLATS